MAEEEAKVRFKFKFIYNPRPCLLPQGYRFATLAEFRDNLHIFRKWGPPVETTGPPFKDGSLDACLLDGFIQGFNNFDKFHEHRGSYIGCEWMVAVKKKEWDSRVNKWRNCSAFYSSSSNLLRKQLYDGIALDGARSVRIAWCNAYYFEDVELLYWLWQNHRIPADPEFDNFASHVGLPLGIFIKALASGGPGFQPQMRNAAEEVPLVLESARDKGTWDWRVALVELFAEVYGSAFFETAAEVVTLTNVESRIPVFTKLLSLIPLHQPQHQIPNIKPCFSEVLVEAVERGYSPLVGMMLQELELDDISIDNCVRALRAAVRGGYIELVRRLLEHLLIKRRDGVELRVEVDDDGKTLFHYALFDKDVFHLLQETYAHLDIDNVVIRQDRFGENILHWAAKGACDSQVVYDILKEYIPSRERLILCCQRDERERTPLHVAASKGNSGVMEKLIDCFQDQDRAKYIQETDSSVQTALQIAAAGGYKHSVSLLLKEGSRPLKERDFQRKTALHHAAAVKDPKIALATCTAIVESTAINANDLSLLLWASAAGIGTADEMEGVDSNVKSYLLRKKEYCRKDLLRKAAITNYAEMAWELLNRGADMADILDSQWRASLRQGEENAVQNVISHMERMKEQGRDQPSIEDNLGRHVFAEGVAALLFNRFVESPITVGISGEWGTGKSSLMIQIEKILLITAAQLTFPNLLPSEQFGGAKRISLSTRGRYIYQQMKKGFHNLFARSKNKPKNPLVTVIAEYQNQYKHVYKSLACMDINQMLESKSTSEEQEQEHALRGVPRILTIRYNAWHYRDQHEAWAGLGVAITKEIENAMTRAQWMSTCWRYTWAKQKANIWIYIFLPCLISITLAGWVAWIVWILLKEARFKGLKYGSIPITVIAIAWTVLKSIISVVKPVSTQMLGYITSPDHTSHLGYQEDVIADINFLQNELGEKPHWFFSFILGVWCWNWFGLYADVIAKTTIPKFMPAYGDRMRIVTFVDDLDRCEEEVILQVLSAVNLVLAECKINVILGIDNKMIARAIRRRFADLDDEDIAEKFIGKVIQIPLSLPDPTGEETRRFLKCRLGHEIPAKYMKMENVFRSPHNIVVASRGGTSTNHRDETRTSEEANVATCCHNTVLNIGCPQMEERCRGIVKNAVDWLGRCLLGVESYEEESFNSLRSAAGVRLIKELLMPSYTKEEANIFYELSGFISGNQKIPREWKRLLHYHKFAWYVLFRIGDVHRLPTWKKELVGWTFICWQWKHEMNYLIKNWDKYYRAVLLSKQSKDGKKRHFRGPLLGEIIDHLISSRPSVSERSNKSKSEDDLMKLSGSTKQDPSIRALLCLYKENETNAEEDAFKYNWSKLSEALKIRDVSMEAVQLFQQFRFYCDTGILETSLKLD